MPDSERDLSSVQGRDWWAPISFLGALGVACWWGWWSGLCSIAYRGVQSLLSPATHQIQAEHFWMAPVAGSLAVGLVWSVTALLLRLGRRPLSYRVATALGVAAFAFSGLRLLGLGIHPWAAALLAAGVGAQLSRPLESRRHGFLRAARGSAPWMVVVTVTVAVAVPAAQRWAEIRAIAALPSPAADSPNVLLLILDTTRARSLSLYGASRTTSPNIDQIAERGVVFEQAFAPAPWTLPSHATLFTGLWPHQHGATWDRRLADDSAPTLAERLAARGYATGGFVANLVFAGSGSGLDRGFHTYRDQSPLAAAFMSALPVVASPVDWLRKVLGYHSEFGRKPAADVNGDFLEWLDGMVDDRPFFAFLNYFDTHLPYRPPAPFDTLFAAAGARYWVDGPSRRAEQYSDEELAELYATYDGAIAYIDDQIGALLEALDERGELANTIVIVTSDHGEQFGEHGFIGHSNTLYEPVMRVPLLVVDPHHPERGGTRVRVPVSLRDIPASVLQRVGAPDLVAGRSLLADQLGTSLRPPVLMELDNGFERPTMVGVIEGKWSYMRTERRETTEELYDLSTDPEQLNDLAVAPVDTATANVLRRLRHLADSLRQGRE